MDNWLYIFINLGAISVPFIASFDRRLRFDKQWRFLFPAMLLTMLIFIPWDMLKTSLGVWGFNPKYITGYYIGNLPVEEWMFFIAIPYACLFTYHALNYLVKKDFLGKYSRTITAVLAIFLLTVGIMNYWQVVYFCNLCIYSWLPGFSPFCDQSRIYGPVLPDVPGYPAAVFYS